MPCTYLFMGEMPYFLYASRKRRDFQIVSYFLGLSSCLREKIIYTRCNDNKINVLGQRVKLLIFCHILTNFINNPQIFVKIMNISFHEYHFGGNGLVSYGDRWMCRGYQTLSTLRML